MRTPSGNSYIFKRDVMSDSKDRILGLICERLKELLPVQARVTDLLPDVAITRYDSNSPPENCLYYPMIALVAQGRKRAFYGEEEVMYGSGEYIALCSDMPGRFHVLDATLEKPFLSISLRLDPNIIINLVADNLFNGERGDNKEVTIGKEAAAEGLLLAFYRLIQLMGEKPYNQFIFELVKKEIHYYLLNSGLGEKLCLFSLPGTRDYRIARAIEILRKNYMRQINMEDLAKQVHMSISTFNKYFKETTSLSPLQFQKRLRLHEAQRLISMEKMDARATSLAVGYESESQFSREYKRYFGITPMKSQSLKRA